MSHVKTCISCGEAKPETAFSRDLRRSTPAETRRKNKCMTCVNAYTAAWARTPAGHRSARRRYLKYFYGITPERWDALVLAQGGLCGICGEPEPSGDGNLCVDHDHDCCPGKRSCGQCVRGLLCHFCNQRYEWGRDNRVSIERYERSSRS